MSAPARRPSLGPRYPLQALVEASGLSEAALAREIGLSGSTLVQARKVGFVESAADRYACRVGLVPWLVWSDWLDDVGVPCPECGERFVPSRKGHVYCDRKCAARAGQRRRYQTSPERAAKAREQARRYYEECADYKKAQMRRRWWADVEASRQKQRDYRARKAAA